MKHLVLVVVMAMGLLLSGCREQSRESQEPSEITGVIVNAEPALESFEPAWLVRNSTAVVEGTVVGVSELGLLDEKHLGPRCYRDVYIEVSRCLKGAVWPGQVTTVRFFTNGTIDGITYEYNQALEFAQGERVLVMISNSVADGVPLVTASDSGKFVIKGDLAVREGAGIPPEYESVPLSEIEALF